jgi:SNF family Na+-dependent transporter
MAQSDRLEEIRFAKTQQWRVATAAVTLLGAIFAVAHTMHRLDTIEKVTGTVLVAVIAIAASAFLFSLYKHLGRTRLSIDRKDSEAWLRGAEVSLTLVAIVIASAIVVGYSLWRGVAAC